MSKAVESIYNLYNNPFNLSPLIVGFYKSYNGQPKDILLSYLVFPLVLYETSREWLKNAKKTSSIRTFCRKNKNLYGLPERVAEFKEITNQCLQYSIDNKFLEIDDTLTVHVVNQNKNCDSSLNTSFKASANLPKLFNELDIVAIYRLLGVKKL